MSDATREIALSLQSSMSAKDYYNNTSGTSNTYAPPSGPPPSMAGSDNRGFGGYGQQQQGYGQMQGGYYVRRMAC